MVNSVADSGHAYARRFASSTLTPAMSHSEVYGGMTQVDFMNKLANTEDLSDVISKLKVCIKTDKATAPSKRLLIIYLVSS
jgi:presequence protease